MLTEEFTQAFNSRIVITANNIKHLTTSQHDQVKANADRAEGLLKNKDFAMFVHGFKISIAEQLAEITAHDDIADRRRIALSNQLAGIDAFVAQLKEAVYWKKQLVKLAITPSDQL